MFFSILSLSFVSLLFLKGLFLFLFFPCPSSISSQQEDWYHIEEIKWCVSPRHSFRIFFIIFPVLDDTVSFAFEFVRTRLPYTSRVPQKEGSARFFFFRATGFSEGSICPACRGLLGLERMVRRWNRCIREIFTRLMDLFVLIANERLCSWSLGSSGAEVFEFRIERF